MRGWTWSLLLLAGPSWAQEQAVQEQMEVHLRQAHVRVVDDTGQPITGLTMDDFKLTIKRAPTAIEYFEEAPLQPEPETQRLEGLNLEVALPGPGKTPARRNMIWVIDTATMSRDAFNGAKLALERLVYDALNERDLVKIVQLEERMEQLTPFSADRQMLRETLSKIERKAVTRTRLERYQEMINRSLTDIDRGALGNHSQISDQYVREKGRAKSAHFWAYFNGMKALEKMLEPLEGERSIWWITGGGYLDVGYDHMLERLTRTFNARNITINTLLVSDLKDIGEGTIVPGADQYRYTPFLGGQFGMDSRSRNTVVENNKQKESSPIESAEQTGGVFAKVTNPEHTYDALGEIEALASHYYILWYRYDGDKHKVKVELRKKNKRVKLYYGKEQAQPKPYHLLKGQERELEFLATLQYGGETSDNFVPAEWGYAVFGSEKDGYQILVGGTLDPSGGATEEYEIGIGLLDESRQPLAVRHKLLTKLPPNAPFAFYDLIESLVLPTFVSCTVHDMSNSRLSLRWFETAPLATSEAGMSLSSLMIFEPGEGARSPTALTAPAVGGETQTGWDPLLMKEGRIRPTFKQRFILPKALEVFFLLQNHPDTLGVYDVFFSVVKEQKVQTLPAAVVLSDATKPGTAYYFCRMETAELPPGEYTLYIKVGHGERQDAVVASQPFTIVGNGDP